MPFNGSGSFTVDGAPFAPATIVASTPMNAKLNDIAGGLSNAMTRDGQSPATADLPMGGHKITGLANASLATDAAAFGQLSARFIERQAPTASPVYIIFALPAGYMEFQLDFEGLTPAADSSLILQISVNGGVSYVSGAADYTVGWTGSFAPGYSSPANSTFMTLGFAAAASGGGIHGRALLTPATVTHKAFLQSTAMVSGITTENLVGTFGSASSAAGTVTHIRVGFNLTTFQNRGQIVLSGIPSA